MNGKKLYEQIRGIASRGMRGSYRLQSSGTATLMLISVSKLASHLRTQLNSSFMAYALKSSAIRGQLMTASKAAVQQAIYLRDTRPLKIPYPSLAEQETIVSKLNLLRTGTQRLESIYGQKLAALEVLKKELLHQAFTGQL